MSVWISPPTGESLAPVAQLVERYRVLMVPRRHGKTLAALEEIRRQRTEKLERIEKLRVEAAALFALERELTKPRKTESFPRSV